MDEIINKVNQSSLQTIDLETFIDKEVPRFVIDLEEYLFQGMVLREKDFRESLAGKDWSEYKGAYVAILCSADAIIPTWAYMLVTSKLTGIAKKVVYGSEDRIVEELFLEKLNMLNPSDYEGAKLVIKGCGDFHIPESCYLAVTERLAPVVSSIMYGEPCSTVPILKNRGK